ncbi:MAG: hypothetical protein AAF492_03355 [Verrucomicrobiota bacterium]
MKRGLILLLSGLFALPLFADDSEHRRGKRGEHRGRDMERHHGPSHHNRDRRFHGPPRGSGGRLDGWYLEKWMKQIQANDPDFFQKMQAMREKDPREFYKALRERLTKHRFEHLMKHDPELKEAVDQIPPKARKKIMSMLSKSGGPPFMGPPRGSPEKGSAEQEERSKQLARDYREASTDEDRQRLRDALKQEIVAVYDARREERLKALRRMEEEISRIKASIEDRDQHRDDIIQQRLEQLLNENAPDRI